ncbi:hypothetical protein D3C78_1787890 [compost metagenome]
MRRLSAVHFPSNHAFSVLNRNFANTLLDEDDANDNCDNRNQNQQHLGKIQEQLIRCAYELLLVDGHNMARDTSHNRSKDQN